MKLFCRAWNWLYVKANGELPCWCDAGESTIIGAADPYTTTAHNLLDLVCEMKYRSLWRQVIDGFVPNCCRECTCLEVVEGGEPPFSRSRGWHYARIVDYQTAKTGLYSSNSVFGVVQVEPCYICYMGCPGCHHCHGVVPVQSPPYSMTMNLFQACLALLTDTGTLQFIGRGEPTLNALLPNMVQLARQRKPGVHIVMDTNANQPFHRAYSEVDELVCSVDGVDQHMYSQYRRKGLFEAAYRFMCEAVGGRATVFWKMILFEGINDSDLHIKRLFDLCRQVGTVAWLIIPWVGSDDRKSILPTKRTKCELRQLCSDLACGVPWDVSCA